MVTVAARESVWTEKEEEVWAARPRVGIEHWARDKVVLSKKMGVDWAGPYNPDVTPWHKGIFKAVEDPEIEEIVIVAGAQTGKSLGVQIVIAYKMDHDPENMLYFTDTDANARYTSKKRIQPMIDSCESLKDKVDDARKRNVLDINFDGGNLTLAGAGGVSQLGAKSAAFVARDETAKWTGSRNEEAEALELAGERVQGQSRFKIMDLSTPVMIGDAILKQYDLSDMGYGYLPCPFCGHYQKLVWEQMKWGHTDKKKSVSPQEAREDTWYECIGCKGKIRDGHKRWMLKGYKRVNKEQKIEETDNRYSGKIVGGDEEAWEIELPGGEVKRYRMVGGEKKNRRWGIHVSRLYVPWRKWGDLAAQWLEIGDDLSKRQTFINAVLALPWKVRTLRVEEDKLAGHIWRGMGAMVVPEGYEWITAGADVQLREIYYSVWAWREDGARHLIEYGVLPPALSSLDVVRTMRYSRVGGGAEIGVGALWVDSRYRGTEVEDYCGAWENCYACKGSTADETPRSGPVSKSMIKTHPKTGRPLPASQWREYISVHPGTFKAELHYQLRYEWDFKDPPDPPERYVSFHDHTEREFFEHITSEVQVEERDRTGRVRYRFKPIRTMNHQLDTTVLAAAAWRWFFMAWVEDKRRRKQKRRRRPRGAKSGILDGLPEI